MKQTNNSPIFLEPQNNDSQGNSRFQVAKVDDSSESEVIPNGTYYDSNNLKSLRHYTREALPRAENYRNILSVHRHVTRPTLDELHDGQLDLQKAKDQNNQEDNVPVDSAVKFGWIKGVLIRCLLNIWGVILFLRLSWVVGQTGIGLGAVIVLLATMVTTITSLSMSAICTNGEVRGGGTYYMISRSLGPEFGGSIGVIFSIANAVAVSMYTVGFAEALQELLKTRGIIIVDGSLNDVRIISCGTICVLLGIAIIGTEWETKAQIVLLVILLTAMFDFMVGSVIPPSAEQKSKGYVGWSASLIATNFMPDFRDGENFFSIFSVFFPAATGILAGANISGDLKDAQKSIPKGTLLAIAITSFSYLLFSFIAGSVVLRDANGLNITSNLDMLSNCELNQDYFAEYSRCKYGLMNHYQVMELVSLFGPLIYAGVFAAALSSALASLVSAPKVFQALCKDKLFPYIEFFGKNSGGEPRRAYLLTFFIATLCCAIGDLNSIAPIISNFFLAAYCLINFSCFHASFAKSPGFRPSFKYYNMWISLAGSFICLTIMFITGWIAALITFIIVLALYVWILYRKPDVNWGSSTQAQTYRSALNSVYKLNFVPDHVKNYRPQILVFSGMTWARPPLIDFANSISKGIGLIICGHVVQGPISQRSRHLMNEEANLWLKKRKIKGFYNLVEEDSLMSGARSMIQSVGMGKLRPNFVLMGFKNNWQDCEYKHLLDYFNVIHEVFDKHLALGILRLPNGLDYSSYGRITELIGGVSQNGVNGMTSGGGFLNASFVSVDLSKGESAGDLCKSDLTSNAVNNGSSSQLSRDSISSRESSPPPSPYTCRVSMPKEMEVISDHPSGIPTNVIPKDVLQAANQFQRKQKKGRIDVWWLYDDGGLTLLVPYLLATRSQWMGCKLHVFALANKKDELDTEQRNMAALLSKFRIDYSDVTVIPDIVKPPQQSSRDVFDALIAKWKTKKSSKNIESNSGDESDSSSENISDSEEIALKDKTNRHLRLRELLCQHSKDASLIVMTLPMPRKGTCSAPLYMAWLETLTYKMPPFLLIRGNQTNVLTFYS